jgi:DNA-binding NarL/FixJ family response regulator
MPGPGGALTPLLRRASGEDAAADPAAREAAFDELLRLVMIAVRAGMGRRLRDHRESADIGQSVARSFVDDFEHGRVAFTTEAELAAYLQRVVRSKLADLARRAALAALSPDDQELLRLRAQGLEWAHIARTLDTDPATLRQRFSRLQKKLGAS